MDDPHGIHVRLAEVDVGHRVLEVGGGVGLVVGFEGASV
jgi:hypothetical protein